MTTFVAWLCTMPSRRQRVDQVMETRPGRQEVSVEEAFDSPEASSTVLRLS
ncbi:hypothetical protein [Streptomyces sp. NPDC001381]|uniref:hypothetical protein n=1 Tax=Streptomyces sp. NPDC001381 TaxID=3364567 RepID=UPI003682FBAA